MATEPNGIDVSSTPALPPACTNERFVPTADRLDEGEIPYPYEQATVPPCAFMNAPMAVLTGYLSLTLPTSEANMFVKGCWPHSGPSKKPPVTGRLACWGYLSAKKNRGLVDTMPAGFFDTASWTAAATSVGLVWSSRTTPVILWPSIPPSTFCRAMRALKPAGALLNSDEPSPVSEVIITRVMGEPDAAAAPAVPAARLVTPAAAANASAASANLPRILPDVVPMVQSFPPQKEPPDPRRVHRHTRSERTVCVSPLRPGVMPGRPSPAR